MMYNKTIRVSCSIATGSEMITLFVLELPKFLVSEFSVSLEKRFPIFVERKKKIFTYHAQNCLCVCNAKHYSQVVYNTNHDGITYIEMNACDAYVRCARLHTKCTAYECLITYMRTLACWSNHWLSRWSACIRITLHVMLSRIYWCAVRI